MKKTDVLEFHIFSQKNAKLFFQSLGRQIKEEDNDSLAVNGIY